MMVDKRCVFSKINSIYFNIARRSRIRCYRNDLGRKKILKKTRDSTFIDSNFIVIVDHSCETKMELTKICGVCGDKALGYNFNALTCESCKAFFRRNALRNKKFHCISNTNKCQLDPKTRKYCRKCRLDKCFSIGMLKEWILTDEEKQMKRRKHRHIELNDADSSTTQNHHQQEQQQQQSTSNDQSNSSTIIDDNNVKRIKINHGQNNIIILPIITSSDKSIINKEKYEQLQTLTTTTTTTNDLIQSIDRKRLIEYINERLDSSSSPLTYDDGHKDQSKDHHNDNNNIIFLNENDSLKNDGGPDLFSYESSSSTTTLFSKNIFNDQQQPQQSSSASPHCSLQPPQPNDPIKFNDIQWSPPSEYLAKNNDTIITNNNNYQSTPKTSTTTSLDNISMLPENVIANQKQYNKWQISSKIYKDVLQKEKVIDDIYDKDPKRFDKMEHDRLEELQRIFVTLNEMDQRSVNSERKIVNNMVEGFQYLEFAIKQLILHIKNVQAFKNLCLVDQEILLKNSVSKIRSLLNIIRCYDPEKNSVNIPYNKNGTLLVYEQDYLRQLHGEQHYERCQNFCQSFHADWKNDDMIVNLLIIIMVFFPNRDGLLHREYITLGLITPT
ncbi:Ligand binding domain of hormone receptors [Dermatophagoides pteronyssinus]|uniref:Ligand binding domain of hormone receptors n=1 Tax=Dermatophagoides pteronyssinus TaxID=6956 RepID=A0ABQ8JUZ2_DERPT|nr:Ligand binding domain of hormone receptors [Dermatophagoides pteronyssinus]